MLLPSSIGVPIRFSRGAEDRFSNHAPLHFDLSVFDVYNSIEAGATVYMLDHETTLFPASVAAFIEEHQLSVWYSVPSALTSLVLHGNLAARHLDRVRLVLFAGEVFPMKYLHLTLEAFPQAEFHNLYGPTETNVCTYFQIDRAQVQHARPLADRKSVCQYRGVCRRRFRPNRRTGGNG